MVIGDGLLVKKEKRIEKRENPKSLTSVL